MAPAVNSSSLGQPRPTLKVSLPLPQFAVSAPGPAPDPAQSPVNAFAAPNSPSLPGSRTSTPPYELLSTDSDYDTPDHAPLAQKAVRASATITSTAGASAFAPVLTQRMLRLHIPDCCVPMAPAVGQVSPGLPKPTMDVFMPLPQSPGSAPGPIPDPVQSPADATQHYPSLPGSRTSIPAYELLSIDTDVAVSASLGPATVVPLTGSSIVGRFVPLILPESQESRLSSVQFSLNRV